MKKKLSTLLAALMLSLFVLSLVSCGGDEEASSASAESGPEKLVVAIQADSFVSDYEDNYFTQYIEEKLGIDIEFYMLSVNPEDVRTQVSLLATGGDDLPDVLLASGTTLTPEAILNYGANGVFAMLDEYIADSELMPNYNAIPAEDKAIMETAQTMADGHTYSLSRFEPETWNLTPNRTFINRAWLDKLGLEMPTTTDELKEVLIAFRDGDPNGNGLADEIGVYGWQSGTYGQNIIASLMNSFVFWNNGIVNGGLSLDEDGKTVIAPFTTEGWRDGLRYLNDLYKEGLLSASTFTDSDTQYRATLNEETNCVGLTSSGSLSSWPDAANNANFLEMELMPPLTGPDGVCYTPYYEYTPNQVAFIFEGTDKMDLAIRFLDAFYDHHLEPVARDHEQDLEGRHTPLLHTRGRQQRHQRHGHLQPRGPDTAEREERGVLLRQAPGEGAPAAALHSRRGQQDTAGDHEHPRLREPEPRQVHHRRPRCRRSRLGHLSVEPGEHGPVRVA